jgi:ATP-binding cassette subfamily B protein
MQSQGLSAGPGGPADAGRAGMLARLETDENALATLEVDLDAQLRFSTGLLALTERRLLARDAAGGWRDWPLQEGLSLRLSDHAGVGTLELCGPDGRLAGWRFTLAANVAALRFVRRFEQQLARRRGDAPEADADEPATCPTCSAPLPPDSDECPSCHRELHTPPSTWVLLRLGRFAGPYRKQLAAGFALTLAATGSTLVPPYLTITLM